jgi:hypothetical protein
MSHTVNTSADLMPAQAAPAFVLVLSNLTTRFDTSFELLTIAHMICSAYLVEWFDDGSCLVTDMPPLPAVAPGVYPLPLAA